MADRRPDKPSRWLFRLVAFGLLVAAVVGTLLFLPRAPKVGVGPLAQGNDSLIFDGRLVEGVLSAGEGLLTIEYAHVIDNGEGAWPPHGPYGSIHVVVYRPEQSPGPPWQPDLELYETMLYGPHQTVGDLFEWLDDERLAYTHYGLYDWNWQEFDWVVLRFYESDPGPGRGHDDLLSVVVSREESQTQSITVHSRAMEVRLRTVNLGRWP